MHSYLTHFSESQLIWIYWAAHCSYFLPECEHRFLFHFLFLSHFSCYFFWKYLLTIVVLLYPFVRLCKFDVMNIVYSANVTANSTIVHISFGKDVYTSMRKELATNILLLTGKIVLNLHWNAYFSKGNLFLFSFSANLGGIYSLFIGSSAITFIEVVYYLIWRFYMNLRQLTHTKPTLK